MMFFDLFFLGNWSNIDYYVTLFKVVMLFCLFFPQVPSLKPTTKTPENGWLEDDEVSFWDTAQPGRCYTFDGRHPAPFGM